MKPGRLGDRSCRKTWASLCQSRLGEACSLGRENQRPPLLIRVTVTHTHPHSPTSIFNRLYSHTGRSIIKHSLNKQILPKIW